MLAFIDSHVRRYHCYGMFLKYDILELFVYQIFNTYGGETAFSPPLNISILAAYFVKYEKRFML